MCAAGADQNHADQTNVDQTNVDQNHADQLRRRGAAVAPSLRRALAVGALACLVTATVQGPARAGGDANVTDGLVPTVTFYSLGDSYSSGEGVPPYDTGTDTDKDECHRSAGAWPRMLSTLTGGIVKLTGHTACSGASIADLSQPYQGEPSQLEVYRQAAEPVATLLTVGGNDLDFAGLLTGCRLTDCSSSSEMTKAEATLADATAQGLTARLAALYTQVRQIHPNSRLVVVSYPGLFPATSTANTCAWMSETERSKLAALEAGLNTAVKNAAATAGAQFVDTAAVLSGHEMCTASARIQLVKPSDVNISSVFDDSLITKVAASGHPDQTGQQEIAAAVVAALSRPSS